MKCSDIFAFIHVKGDNAIRTMIDIIISSIVLIEYEYYYSLHNASAIFIAPVPSIKCRMD